MKRKATPHKYTWKRPSTQFWLLVWIGIFVWVLAAFILFLFPLRLDVDPKSYIGLSTAEAEEKAYREYVALVAKRSNHPQGACAAVGRGSYRGTLTYEPCSVPRTEAAKERLRIVKVVVVNNKIIEAGSW